MKNLAILMSMFVFANLNAQNVLKMNADSTFKNKILVEASCGQCKFKMKGKGCTLAVRINNIPYFVDKTDIEQFGDAHAKMGFCNAIRKAYVTGKIQNNKFIASSFELVEK